MNFLRKIFHNKTDKQNQYNKIDNNAQHSKKLKAYCDALAEIWTITLPINRDNISKTIISWEWTTITKFKEAKGGILELYNEYLNIKVGNVKLEIFKIPFLHKDNEIGSIKIGVYFPVSQVVKDLTGVSSVGDLIFHSMHLLASPYHSLEHGVNPKLGEIVTQTWEECTGKTSKDIACFKISFYSLNSETREYHTIWFLVDGELLEYLLNQDEKNRKRKDEVYILELIKKAKAEYDKQYNII